MRWWPITAGQRRLRLLPSRVGVYFVLALCLFPGAGYLGVWAKLTAALDGLGLAVPSSRALRDLRRRLGPFRALFEVLAGPLGRPSTPGVMFGRYRTVAFDGCRSIKVPDTAGNRGWLGKLNAALGQTGYPVIQLMTLCETGTRALLGASFGTPGEGELAWARQLLHHLDQTMLVLMDRGFDAAEFLREVHATGAALLVRLRSTRCPPVLKRFSDGSYLSMIGGVQVRIVTAEVSLTCHDGTRYGDSYRIATTLLDHRGWPAEALIGLYHEAVGTRNHLPRPAAHPAARSGAAFGRPGRPAAGDVGPAYRLPGAAHRHHRRNRPDRPDRPHRAGQPAPAAPAPRLRPQGQIPALALEQAPARQTHHQPASHQDHHRDRPKSPAAGNTPSTILDTGAQPLTPRH